MNEKEIERILKALANERRLKIISYIKKKKRAPVGDIARAINLSFRSTSKHLSVLAAANIIEKEQQGLLMFYFFSYKFKSSINSILKLLS